MKVSTEPMIGQVYSRKIHGSKLMPRDVNPKVRSARSEWRFILFITVFPATIVFLLANGAAVLAGLTFTIFSATCLALAFRFLFQAQQKEVEKSTDDGQGLRAL
jgi:hypothetical protein